MEEDSQNIYPDAELSSQRQEEDYRVALDRKKDEVIGGRAQGLSPNLYLRPYKEQEEDLGHVEYPKALDIIPHGLLSNVIFDIISVMIQLLSLTGVSTGLPIDDVYMHFINFIGICTSYIIPKVDQEALTLTLVPFSIIC